MPRKAKCLIPLALVLLTGALYAPAASASTTQSSVFQDDSLLKADPAGTMAILHSLGVDRVRVNLTWSTVAPDPRSTHAPGFNASDPAAYPARSWAPYDAIVREGQAYGISVYFTLNPPAPRWADGSGEASGAAGFWKPSAKDFGQFVHAAGERYDGFYKPGGSSTALPRVSFWSIWNEPNYFVGLAPQTNNSGSAVLAAGEYRGLLAAAWGSLVGTGHTPGRDTILIGELAPRGSNGVPGIYGGTKPLTFLRALYCVGSNYKELRGSAAAAIGCPTTAAGSRSFRAHNTALFQASGFADHPYTLQGHPVAPNVPTNYYGGGRSDPNYSDLPEVGRLSGVLNRLNGTYGSHKHFPIYNTEYGYRTIPPDHVGVSQATQAAWINWAEYLSWKQPEIASFDQYLLRDPGNGLFATGLERANGAPKASFAAYRMPLWLPVTSPRRGRTLEVWGDVRPAHFAGPGQVVQIQLKRGSGAFTTVKTVTIANPQGYFDVRVTFPGSGTVRTLWNGYSSRSQRIRVHWGGE
jgi:hypothetical protein